MEMIDDQSIVKPVETDNWFIMLSTVICQDIGYSYVNPDFSYSLFEYNVQSLCLT